MAYVNVQRIKLVNGFLWETIYTESYSTYIYR